MRGAARTETRGVRPAGARVTCEIRAVAAAPSPQADADMRFPRRRCLSRSVSASRRSPDRAAWRAPDGPGGAVQKFAFM
ncbi:hypothetical protein GCM10010187_74180 [Actinomadura coerulea]|nr:hypothetical protein GCM10010187_74180 [Actinomadura coerulea]